MSARGETRSQVKALLWEESRVGGMIVLASLGVSVVLLLQARQFFGDRGWIRDEMMVHFAALGIPLLTAVLVILNPDYSGHLTGGFSKRILRYPVQTPIAVAVSLFARTFMIFAMSALLTTLASLLFDGTPGFIVVCSITVFYLAAQLIDWLRGPLRGLSSLVVLALTATLIGYIVWPGMPDFNPIGWTVSFAQRMPVVLPFAIPVLLAAVYAVAAPLVHADRIGRSYGIPEIWEWPRAVTISRSVSTKPFRSPIAAQVWFELRRARWLIPIVTVVIVCIYIALIWIRVHNNSWDGDDDNTLSVVVRFGVFFAIVLGAAVHGVQTRVIGFRRKARMSGYEYMQPLTDAQFASARLIAAALLLVPTLVIALVLHFAIPGHYFVNVVLSDALGAGMLSVREATWLFVSRGLFVCLLAWTMLAIGTRLFRYLLAVAGVALLLIGIAGIFGDDSLSENLALAFMKAAPFALLITIAVVTVRSLRCGAVSLRILVPWFVGWMMLAWLFHYALINMHPAFPLSRGAEILALSTALGAGALFPLVYFAILADLRRRRLDVRIAQDRAQHRARFGVPQAVATVVLAAFALWLGWPAAPQFIQYRAAHQLPWPTWPPPDVDVRLDPRQIVFGGRAWYPEAPTSDNVAPAYVKVARDSRRLHMGYQARLKNELRDGPDNWLEYPKNFLMVIGGAEQARSGPIEKKKWEATERYWNEVTSKVAPALKGIARLNTRNSQYLFTVDRFYHMESDQTRRVYESSKQLELDALHWAVQGDPTAAAESILALLAMAQSFEGAPQAQTTRLEMTAARSVEILLNRSVPDAATLERLAIAFSDALPEIGRDTGLRKSVMWDTVSQLRRVGYEGMESDIQPEFYFLFNQLAQPSVVEAISLSLQERKTLAQLDQPWPEIATSNARLGSAYANEGSAFYASLYNYSGYSYLAEHAVRTRTNVNLARTAIAIERFRLANRRLPNSTSELVPVFLEELPDDPFAGTGIPLRYLVRDTGEYIVYSLGRDTLDSQGRSGFVEKKSMDDIAFTVAPMSVRTGPQVAEGVTAEDAA